jgi:hypothetical protein
MLSKNILELTDETTYPIPLVFFTVVYYRRQCQLHAHNGETMIEQYQLNQQALEDPQPGDYWHERFSPYFLVVARNGDNITVLSALGGANSYYRKHETCARVDVKDGWQWDYDKTMTVDREWIRKTVLYGVIDGFIADVHRNGESQKVMLKEWREHRIQQLVREFRELGPEASQYLLKTFQ